MEEPSWDSPQGHEPAHHPGGRACQEGPALPARLSFSCPELAFGLTAAHQAGVLRDPPRGPTRTQGLGSGRLPGEEYPPGTHRCLESPGLCCSASSPPLTAGGRLPRSQPRTEQTSSLQPQLCSLESPGVCKSQTVAEAPFSRDLKQHCSGRRDREIQD